MGLLYDVPTSEVRFTCKQEAIRLIQIDLTRLIYGALAGVFLKWRERQRNRQIPEFVYI